MPDSPISSVRIGFIGAGNIAEIHAAAIRSIAGLELVAVADPVSDRVAAFARRWGVRQSFVRTEDMLAASNIDAVHVLVPPPLHEAMGLVALRAAVDVFLEKPMAQSADECALLEEAATASGATLKVNHNFVHHPAHVVAKRMLAANRIGRLRHIVCRYNMPLRQLASRQFGHWMFESPRNLLLEQAVHPLSQIDDLLGPVTMVTALAATPLSISQAQEFHRTWLISLQSARGTAQLHFSLGETFPVWGMTAQGDDGTIVVDYLGNTVVCDTSGRYPDAFDQLRRKSQMAAALQFQELGNFLTYGTAILGLRSRSDTFFLSMQRSIERFYRERSTPKPVNRSDGRRIVELCERVVAASGLRPARPNVISTTGASNYEVLVIGGTGFIGCHLIPRLLRDGRRIGVFARGVANLPDLFRDPRVAVIRGDARVTEDLVRAVAGVSSVVNLAHGGGGGSRAEAEANLAGSAVAVGEACLAGRVRRLVHVSSIASLYLGNEAEVITGQTPVDPEFDERADYARAKAIAERSLLNLYNERGLPVCILRPGVVIGAAGIAFHSGVGFFNHDNHCMGWNHGNNALPLVLAEDVAESIIRALEVADIDGKCFNIVGDVRLNAHEYIEELAKATGRPLRFHPQSVLKLYALELVKTVLKKAGGRRDVWPSLRDLKSRGLRAQFDCADARQQLGWHPMQDRAVFIARGFGVHGPAAT